MVKTAITSKKQFDELINSGKYIVIDFWADWCGPCRMMAPMFEKFSNLEEFAGVEFYTVDTEALDDVSHEVGVKALPVFMLFQGGNKIAETVGANPTKLQGMLKDAAAAAKAAGSGKPVEPTIAAQPPPPAAAPPSAHAPAAGGAADGAAGDAGAADGGGGGGE